MHLVGDQVFMVQREATPSCLDPPHCSEKVGAFLCFLLVVYRCHRTWSSVIRNGGNDPGSKKGTQGCRTAESVMRSRWGSIGIYCTIETGRGGVRVCVRLCARGRAGIRACGRASFVFSLSLSVLPVLSVSVCLCVCVCVGCVCVHVCI